jgi:hypothetical protein
MVKLNLLPSASLEVSRPLGAAIEGGPRFGPEPLGLRRLRLLARRFVPVGCLLALAFSLCVGARAERGQNAGIYRDGAGGQHAWVIQRSHALHWDDKPYVPSGVVFRSAYLKAPSAATLQTDAQELDQLRAAGILDLWVEPQRGLLECSVEETQAVVDLLESRGFRYGFRVGDRHRGPLTGFSPTLSPMRLSATRLQPGAHETWIIPTPKARRAVYAVVSAAPDERRQDFTIATGEASVDANGATVDVRLRNSSLLGKTRGLLWVVPEVEIEPEELGSFGDLWAGMQGYTVRLKRHLQAVKFGPGLRFLLDPFAAGDGSVGREELVFPSSPAFHEAFKEWLTRRTGGILSLNLHWRTTDRRINDYEQAARMIPLWARNDPPEEDGWLFDPVEKQAYRCTPRQSAIWRDLEEFRTQTLKRWMNSICTQLRTEGLNVPMLFTWSAYHPLFTNNPSAAGYDGLGAQLFGQPASLGAETAAYALAQAEGADRCTWLVATRLAGPPGPNGAPAALASSGEAKALWQAALEVGFRGVYLDPQQVPNAGAVARELAAAQSASSAVVDRVPRVCFFPMALLATERASRLSNGVWWVPSQNPAGVLTLGGTMRGYQIDHPFGPDHSVESGVVLWTTSGKQEATFYADRPDALQLYSTAGEPMKFEKKKFEFKLQLSEQPVVATGIQGSSLFPMEQATLALEEFDALLKVAEARKLDSASHRSVYQEAKRNLTVGTAAVVHNMVQPNLSQLRRELTPYIWLEGERSSSHNFTGIAYQPGASAGTYLRLDRLSAPQAGVMRARYLFDIRRDGSYEIWIAGRVPGRPGVSPLLWQIDDEVAVELRQAEPKGADYASGLAWFTLGRLTLKAGRHELTLVVAEKAEGEGGKYAAGIDTVVLSQEPFNPRGIERPFNPRAEEKARTEGGRRSGGKK